MEQFTVQETLGSVHEVHAAHSSPAESRELTADGRVTTMLYAGRVDHSTPSHLLGVEIHVALLEGLERLTNRRLPPRGRLEHLGALGECRLPL